VENRAYSLCPPRCPCESLPHDRDGGMRERQADGHLVGPQGVVAAGAEAIVGAEHEECAHGDGVSVARHHDRVRE